VKQGKPVKIELRRSFSASLESVFDAWLIPYLAGSWMFGAKSLNQEIITLENEPRSEGKFLLVVKRDGQEQRLTGQYEEIRRPEKLVCSWGADESTAKLNRLVLKLESVDSKTRMKLTHELDASLVESTESESADALRNEWAARCKALAELVETSGKQARLFK
jgi:uncharacterized protein YndB with AHSA1/START domain